MLFVQFMYLGTRKYLHTVQKYEKYANEWQSLADFL